LIFNDLCGAVRGQARELELKDELRHWQYKAAGRRRAEKRKQHNSFDSHVLCP